MDTLGNSFQLIQDWRNNILSELHKVEEQKGTTHRKLNQVIEIMRHNLKNLVNANNSAFLDLNEVPDR